MRCWVSGWTNPKTLVHDVQRQVDVPLIDPASCQNFLRKTALGAKFILDVSSFICAGGEKGKGDKTLSDLLLCGHQFPIFFRCTHW